jgi:DNA mismatch repair protein MutS
MRPNLGAEEKIHKIEVELFEQLVSWITYIKASSNEC